MLHAVLTQLLLIPSVLSAFKQPGTASLGGRRGDVVLILLVMCTANYHGPTCFTNLNPLLAKAGMGEEAVFFLHLERLRSSCPRVHCKEAKECYHVIFLWVRNQQPPKNIGSE